MTTPDGGELQGGRAAFRGWEWITIELERARWFAETPMRLGLEFRPTGGSAVRVPEAGVFAARIGG